jgi:hypothetical protein
MLERTTRTSTFDGFSYVDDAHTNTLLEWGASREEAAKRQGGSGSLGGSPGSRSPGRRSPHLGGSPARNSGTYSTSPSRLRNVRR